MLHLKPSADNGFKQIVLLMPGVLLPCLKLFIFFKEKSSEVENLSRLVYSCNKNPLKFSINFFSGVAKQMKRNSNPWKNFWVVTAFIVLTDAFFILINYRSAWQTLEQDILSRNRHIRAAFDISLMSTATNMQQIATYIANEAYVPAVFLEGKKAVEEEGGGPGGNKAALVRRKLYEHVRPGWEKMTQDYDVRQLHFHLGPGSLSFLRVHAPHKFGDRMDKVRYTIVDCNAARIPTKGFETGRVYSGIRGVVPVFATDPETGEKVHAGALEAGTSMAILIDSLKPATGHHMAVLLTLEHLKQNVWHEFLQPRLEKNLIGNSFVLEEGMEADLKLLKSPEVVHSIIKKNLVILDKENPPLAVSSFSFKDYRQSLSPNGKPVGHVVMWQDIASEIQAVKKGLTINILYGLIVFALVECILFFSWKTGIQRLQEVIRVKTRDLEKTNTLLQTEILIRERAEKKYRHIFEDAPVGIVSQTDKTGTLSVNLACAGIHGYDTPEEFIRALDYNACNLFADPEKYEELRGLLKQDKVVKDFECKTLKRDKSELWVSINSSLREDQAVDGIRWVDSFIIDVSGRKKHEKLKEEVHHMTRHDLKGPLTGIINLPTLISLEKNLTPLQEEYLENIRRAGFRMTEMINMSLNLYKMEIGEYLFCPFNLDFEELLKKVVAELEGLCASMKVRICFEALKSEGHGPDEFVAPGEETLCFTLFQNLLKNAIEASAEGQTVLISLRRTDQAIQIKIHNQGQVPEELIPCFFEKYATAGKLGGTGLGTYSAKLFTQIHGGEIQVTSDAETGVVLSVCLPAGPGLN